MHAITLQCTKCNAVINAEAEIISPDYDRMFLKCWKCSAAENALAEAERHKRQYLDAYADMIEATK